MDEKELEKLRSSIEDLKEELDLQEELLSLEDDLDLGIQGKISNIKKRIKALEDGLIEIKELYLLKPNVIINFRKRATEIKEEIVLLS